jgi:hypothetical protein
MSDASSMDCILETDLASSAEKSGRNLGEVLRREIAAR